MTSLSRDGQRRGFLGLLPGEPAPSPDKMEDPKKNGAGNSAEVGAGRGAWPDREQCLQGLLRVDPRGWPISGAIWDCAHAELNLAASVHVRPVCLEGLG